MTEHPYVQALSNALEELYAAISALVEDTQPKTPLPRLRRFEIAPGIVWPDPEAQRISDITFTDGRWTYERRLDLGCERESLAREICRRCGYQPQLVLRALRRIQAAAAWCYARAEGRRRAAQEILRQQREALEILEAEAALVALKA